jgi:hypothetical protein
MIRRWMLLWAAWLATSTGGAIAQDRFDLFCSIQEVNTFRPNQVGHFKRHLSIDVSAGVWCIRDLNCDTIWKIVNVSDAELILGDADNKFMKLEVSIDRKTLAWSNSTHIKQFIDSGGKAHGPCKRAPFTPFPNSADTTSPKELGVE